MPPPAAPTPTRRREGGLRESHTHTHTHAHAHAHTPPYPYEYGMMSPNSYTKPQPPASYQHYGADPHGSLSLPPLSRERERESGHEPTGGWSPSYGNEHSHLQLPSRQYQNQHQNQHQPHTPLPSYWNPPTLSPYDAYSRGGGPPPTDSLRGTHGHGHHRTPSRRPYGGVGVGVGELLSEPPWMTTASTSSSDDHDHHQQREDFSPPAPVTESGQAAPQAATTNTREVQVSVSASADSEETTPRAALSTAASASANLVTPLKRVHCENINNDLHMCDETTNNDNDRNDDNDNGSGGSKQGKDENGDPLSVLADVSASAGMGGKNKNKQQRKHNQSKQGTETKAPEAAATQSKEAIESTHNSTNSTVINTKTKTNTTSAGTKRSRPSVPMPAPTSPLSRRFKPSPITPSQTPHQVIGRHRVGDINISKHITTPHKTRNHQPITPSRSHDTASSSVEENGSGGGLHSRSRSHTRQLQLRHWGQPPEHSSSLQEGRFGPRSGEPYPTIRLADVTPDRSAEITPEHGTTLSLLHPDQRGSGDSGGGGSYNNNNINSPTSSRRNRSARRHHRYAGAAGDYGGHTPSSYHPADSYSHTHSPALVERGSFDSHGDASFHRGGALLYPPPPSTPNSSRGGAYFYDDHPPPPPGYGTNAAGGEGRSYWDSGPQPPPPYSPTSTSYHHAPPIGRGAGGWNQPPHPLSAHFDPFHRPSLPHGPPPLPPPEYAYSSPPPPSHYGGGPEDPDSLYGSNNYPPLPYYHPHRGGPPPPMPGSIHPGMSMHPHPMVGPPPPFPYRPHPSRMEEKTILRKKFSWKHYPELERFLIANRDEYLKHSNMNYTAEQKQYNNWLTEQLLEVARTHNYMFDPEDFNFVAIRDRIRCYYKSYVQTARKRGLKLPEKKALKAKVVDTATE